MYPSLRRDWAICRRSRSMKAYLFSWSGFIETDWRRRELAIPPVRVDFVPESVKPSTALALQNSENMKIAIVGLGYVGLPLSLQFARSDTEVLGLDIDLAKVKSLLAGCSYIKHIPSSAIAQAVEAGRFSASTD